MFVSCVLQQRYCVLLNCGQKRFIFKPLLKHLFNGASELVISSRYPYSWETEKTSGQATVREDSANSPKGGPVLWLRPSGFPGFSGVDWLPSDRSQDSLNKSFWGQTDVQADVVTLIGSPIAETSQRYLKSQRPRHFHRDPYLQMGPGWTQYIQESETDANLFCPHTWKALSHANLPASSQG